MQYRFSAVDRARTGLATSLGNLLATESVRFTLGALGGLLSLGVLVTLLGCVDSSASLKQPEGGNGSEARMPFEIARAS